MGLNLLILKILQIEPNTNLKSCGPESRKAEKLIFVIFINKKKACLFKKTY